jgi:hypothetical protein
MLWALTLLLPLAAAGQARPDTVEWQLVDTVWVKPADSAGCCYWLRAFRIAVRGRKSWDTLPVLALSPGQLGDGTLLLRVVTKEQEIVLRRFGTLRRSLTVVSAPAGYPAGATLPMFFAPRRLLAYATTGGRVEVRQWPEWKLVAQSPEIEGCSDTLLGIEWNPDGTYVRWYPPKCTPQTPPVDSIRVP